MLCCRKFTKCSQVEVVCSCVPASLRWVIFTFGLCVPGCLLKKLKHFDSVSLCNAYFYQKIGFHDMVMLLSFCCKIMLYSCSVVLYIVIYSYKLYLF